MPELPEVQTVINDLKRAGLLGARIASAQVFWSRSIAGLGGKRFCHAVQGKKISRIWRRGKYIIFDFEDGHSLLVHLRMTGRFRLTTSCEDRVKHEHVILELHDGRQLRFHDTRKFGRLYLVRGNRMPLDSLGIEPLSKAFTVKLFETRLRTKKRLLKPLLLDQSFVAGLGNIYVDEALWEARLHPCRNSQSLSKREVKILHRAIVKVLVQGVKYGGTTLGVGKSNFSSVKNKRGRNWNKLKVFRRTALPCPRCQAPIERIIVGQRSTHICPRCQH